MAWCIPPRTKKLKKVLILIYFKNAKVNMILLLCLAENSSVYSSDEEIEEEEGNFFFLFHNTL